METNLVVSSRVSRSLTRLLAQRDGPRVLINFDRHAGQRRLRGTVENRSGFGGIEGCAVTGTDEFPGGGIVVDGTTSVGAGGVEGDKLTVAEMNQNTGITVRGQGKVDRAIRGDAVDVRDHAIGQRGSRRGARDGRAKSWRDLSGIEIVGVG